MEGGGRFGWVGCRFLLDMGNKGARMVCMNTTRSNLQVAETSEQFSDLLSDTEIMKLRADGVVSAKERGFKGFQRLITLVRQESSETLTLSALREELGTRNTRRRPMTVGKR
jgi:hypothetical protein